MWHIFGIHIFHNGREKCVCVFIYEAESPLYWRRSDTKSHVDPLCRNSSAHINVQIHSDAHHCQISSFDETLAEDLKHKAGMLWSHVYANESESRWSAAWWVSSSFSEVSMPIMQGYISQWTKCSLVCTVLDIFTAQGSVCHQQAVAVMLYCLLT